MLFNSIDFAIFLPIVFTLYWLTSKHIRIQNLLVIVASYVFYAWWDWRFLSLIIFSTVVDYSIGIALTKEKKSFNRKILLGISILANIGLLGFFKYYNFFLENFVAAFSFFGNEISPNALNIVLPVGISFYTFQTLSYSIDIYRKKIEPTKDFVAYAAFVGFFPQLVAGPIERAGNLLPQFLKERTFDYSKAVDGLRQILWGLFKKIVIADNCAIYANEIFNNSADYNGSTLVIGAIFFTFQIYGDFSGYTDMAIGIARLFGFNLRRNFNFPYFSRDIAEFWRRWHISLSTWFRDYLYIPLGGSRVKKNLVVLNIFIVFIVSGFWHGANWTYIAWGVLNAIYIIPLFLLGKHRKNLDIVAQKRNLPNLKEIFQISLTFGLTVFAWIFFRAENMPHAFSYISKIFSQSLFEQPYFPDMLSAIFVVALVLFFIIIEWIGRENQYGIEKFLANKNRVIRWLFYFLITFIIVTTQETKMEFIYFQF